MKVKSYISSPFLGDDLPYESALAQAVSLMMLLQPTFHPIIVLSFFTLFFCQALLRNFTSLIYFLHPRKVQASINPQRKSRESSYTKVVGEKEHLNDASAPNVKCLTTEDIFCLPHTCLDCSRLVLNTRGMLLIAIALLAPPLPRRCAWGLRTCRLRVHFESRTHTSFLRNADGDTPRLLLHSTMYLILYVVHTWNLIIGLSNESKADLGLSLDSKSADQS